MDKREGDDEMIKVRERAQREERRLTRIGATKARHEWSTQLM